MSQTSLNSTGVASSGSLVLQTNGTTAAVTVDTAQNVGVGVTPSAWNTAVKGLQVNNAALSCFTSGGNVQTWLTNNAYYDAGGWKYKTSSVGANQYSQIYDGSHAWFSAPLGTAGNAITFTQAMTLDASGNLLVGATSAATNVSGLWMFNQSGTNGRVNIIKTSSGTSSAIANYYNGTYVGGLDYSNTATLLVASSDERLKQNIVTAPIALNKVNAIEVVSYDWKHDPSHVEFGFVAQKLNTVYPEAVIEGDNGEEITKTWGVEYGRLTPLLVKAIQEQQTQISDQLAIIESLTARITALEVA